MIGFQVTGVILDIIDVIIMIGIITQDIIIGIVIIIQEIGIMIDIIGINRKLVWDFSHTKLMHRGKKWIVQNAD